MFVPSPSWPAVLSPQAQTVPLLFSARLWLSPAEIIVIDERLNFPGVERCEEVPSPNWPCALLPHVQTVPSLRNAMLCPPPPASDVVLEEFEVAMGELRLL